MLARVFADAVAVTVAYELTAIHFGVCPTITTVVHRHRCPAISAAVGSGIIAFAGWALLHLLVWA
jgi:hypothetical protein